MSFSTMYGNVFPVSTVSLERAIVHQRLKLWWRNWRNILKASAMCRLRLLRAMFSRWSLFIANEDLTNFRVSVFMELANDVVKEMPIKDHTKRLVLSPLPRRQSLLLPPNSANINYCSALYQRPFNKWLAFIDVRRVEKNLDTCINLYLSLRSLRLWRLYFSRRCETFNQDYNVVIMGDDHWMKGQYHRAFDHWRQLHRLKRLQNAFVNDVVGLQNAKWCHFAFDTLRTWAHNRRSKYNLSQTSFLPQLSNSFGGNSIVVACPLNPLRVRLHLSFKYFQRYLAVYVENRAMECVQDKIAKQLQLARHLNLWQQYFKSRIKRLLLYSCSRGAQALHIIKKPHIIHRSVREEGVFNPVMIDFDVVRRSFFSKWVNFSRLSSVKLYDGLCGSSQIQRYIPTHKLVKHAAVQCRERMLLKALYRWLDGPIYRCRSRYSLFIRLVDVWHPPITASPQAVLASRLRDEVVARSTASSVGNYKSIPMASSFRHANFIILAGLCPSVVRNCFNRYVRRIGQLAEIRHNSKHRYMLWKSECVWKQTGEFMCSDDIRNASQRLWDECLADQYLVRIRMASFFSCLVSLGKQKEQSKTAVAMTTNYFVHVCVLNSFRQWCGYYQWKIKLYRARRKQVKALHRMAQLRALCIWSNFVLMKHRKRRSKLRKKFSLKLAAKPTSAHESDNCMNRKGREMVCEEEVEGSSVDNSQLFPELAKSTDYKAGSPTAQTNTCDGSSTSVAVETLQLNTPSAADECTIGDPLDFSISPVSSVYSVSSFLEICQYPSPPMANPPLPANIADLSSSAGQLSLYTLASCNGASDSVDVASPVINERPAVAITVQAVGQRTFSPNNSPTGKDRTIDYKTSVGLAHKPSVHAIEAKKSVLSHQVSRALRRWSSSLIRTAVNVQLDAIAHHFHVLNQYKYGLLRLVLFLQESRRRRNPRATSTWEE